MWDLWMFKPGGTYINQVGCAGFNNMWFPMWQACENSSGLKMFMYFIYALLEVTSTKRAVYLN
jgi:hypothetical protein